MEPNPEDQITNFLRQLWIPVCGKRKRHASEPDFCRRKKKKPKLNIPTSTAGDEPQPMSTDNSGAGAPVPDAEMEEVYNSYELFTATTDVVGQPQQAAEGRNNGNGNRLLVVATGLALALIMRMYQMATQ